MESRRDCAVNLPRREAAARGDKTFDSREPCRKCGAYKRWTSNYGCIQCMRVYGKEYHKHYTRTEKRRGPRLASYYPGAVRRRESAWRLFRQAIDDKNETPERIRKLLREWERWDVRAALQEHRSPFFNEALIRRLEEMEHDENDSLAVGNRAARRTYDDFEYHGNPLEYSNP